MRSSRHSAQHGMRSPAAFCGVRSATARYPATQYPVPSATEGRRTGKEDGPPATPRIRATRARAPRAWCWPQGSSGSQSGSAAKARRRRTRARTCSTPAVGKGLQAEGVLPHATRRVAVLFIDGGSRQDAADRAAIYSESRHAVAPALSARTGADCSATSRRHARSVSSAASRGARAARGMTICERKAPR
jgi:hypothetical protein